MKPELFSAEELEQWETNQGNRFKLYDELCMEMSPYDDLDEPAGGCNTLLLNSVTLVTSSLVCGLALLM